MIKKEKLIILGKSGSGKDFLMREISKKNLNPCLKWTTRPKRTREEQGREYNFVSRNEFERAINNNEMIAHQLFTVTPLNSEPEEWYYGLSKKDFNDSQVVIMTPGEYDLLNFEEVDRKELFVVYLNIDRQTREDRLYNREDKMDSIKRRLDADDVDFSNFKDYDLMVRDPEFSSEDIYNLMD